MCFFPSRDYEEFKNRLRVLFPSMSPVSETQHILGEWNNVECRWRLHDAHGFWAQPLEGSVEPFRCPERLFWNLGCRGWRKPPPVGKLAESLGGYTAPRAPYHSAESTLRMLLASTYPLPAPLRGAFGWLPQHISLIRAKTSPSFPSWEEGGGHGVGKKCLRNILISNKDRLAVKGLQYNCSTLKNNR